MQELVAEFVPVADEVWWLQHGPGAESEWFRTIAEQGHYAGRTVPTDTRQGTYMAAPSGRLLASLNHNAPERMIAALEKALAAWRDMSREERLGADAPEAEPERRRRKEWQRPDDGLVLQVVSRDLERPEGFPGSGDWRGRAWNLDHAWFRAAEARGLLPAGPFADAVGREHDVTRALVARLARAHLVDNVRGQTVAYRPADVEIARLTTVIDRVEVAPVPPDGEPPPPALLVHVTFTGRTRTAVEGEWHTGSGEPRPTRRGVDVNLRGSAVWHTGHERFTAFELVAAGTRWGATRYNGRRDDLDPAPIGFVLRLAGDDPADRVAPAHLGAYGW